MSAPPGDIHAVAAEYLGRLEAAESAAMRELESRYRDVFNALQSDLQALQERIDGAIERGQPLNADWLRRERRVRIVLDQIEEEVGRIAEGLATSTAQVQSQAAILGSRSVLATLAAGGITDRVALPNTALIDLVGRLQDGSPLRDLLDDLGPDASRRAEAALVETIGRGTGPRKAIPAIQDALGGNLARAETIARTEIVGSYRRASYRQAQAHADVLVGWTWVAAVSSRDAPCAVCYAMHGTFHPMNEQMYSHPRCRCVQAFVPRGSMADLGPDGEEMFDALPEEEQRSILGPAAHDAYRAGRITLADIPKRVDHPRWGPGLRRRSNAEMGV